MPDQRYFPQSREAAQMLADRIEDRWHEFARERSVQSPGVSGYNDLNDPVAGKVGIMEGGRDKIASALSAYGCDAIGLFGVPVDDTDGRTIDLRIPVSTGREEFEDLVLPEVPLTLVRQGERTRGPGLVNRVLDLFSPLSQEPK